MGTKQKVQTTKTVKKKTKFNIGDMVSVTWFYWGSDVVVYKIIYIHLSTNWKILYKLDGLQCKYPEDELTKQS